MEISLFDFLTNGQLGQLTINVSSREDVVRLLGEPLDWDADSKRWEHARIWKYNDLQLSFDDNILSYIGIYPKRTSPNLPAPLEITGKFLTNQTSLEEVRDYLNKKSIQHTIITNPSLQIKIGGTAIITFFDADSLYSIAIF